MEESTVGTTSPAGAGGNAVGSDSQIRALEARIVGLQTALNAKHSELESTKQGLEAAVAKLTQELHAKQTDVDKFRQESLEQQKRFEEAMAKASEYESNSAKLLREVERYKTLAQYPQVWPDLPILIGDEEKIGLMPKDIEGDALKAWLDTYVSRLGDAQSAARNQVLSGVSSAGGGQRQGSPSKEALMQQMLKLQAEGKGRSPEYDALYAQLLTM